MLKLDYSFIGQLDALITEMSEKIIDNTWNGYDLDDMLLLGWQETIGVNEEGYLADDIKLYLETLHYGDLQTIAQFLDEIDE